MSKPQRRKHWTQTARGRRFQRNKMRRFWRERKDVQTAEVINARLVDNLENTLPLDDYGKNALEAILNNVWSGFTLAEKIEALDPRDPSNPDGL